MKVLVLGSSRQFARPGVTQDETFANQLDNSPQIKALGLDIKRQFAWPNERLPGLVEQWMAEESPEMVVILINEAWFNYEGVPLKKMKSKGRFGRLVNHAWRIVAEQPVVANSRTAHRLRRRVASATGAEAQFSPAEVIESMATVFRTILRADESTSILALGPLPLAEFDANYSESVVRRRMTRREEVNAGIAKLCADLHLEHIDMHHEALKQRAMPSIQADGLHTDAAGGRQDAAFWSPILAPYLLRELGRRGQLPDQSRI